MTGWDRVKRGPSERLDDVQNSEEEPLSPKLQVDVEESMELQSDQSSSLADQNFRSETKKSNSTQRTNSTLSEQYCVQQNAKSEKKPTNRAQAIVSHTNFKLFINIVVALNVLELGIESDVSDERLTTICTVAEHIFTAVFVIEMILKLMAFGCSYFAEKMNILDFLIAWIAVLDMWCMDILFQVVIPNLNVVKILRLLRIIRIAKLFSAQHQLYMLVEGISASLWSLMWIGCLLLVINYTFALVCVQLFGKDDYGDEYLPQFSNSRQFGTVPNAMLSLFNIVLLDEWTTIIRPIYENSPWGVPFMVTFVVFTACGLLNVMIGVIVEKCSESKDSVQQSEKRLACEQKMVAFAALAQIIKDVDLDGNSRLSKLEANHLTTNSDFMNLLQKIDLPSGFTIDDLFLLLRRFDDPDEEIHENDFINGMLRLVFSNDFQNTCMLHLSLNEIKQDIRNLQREMQFTRESHSKVANETAAIYSKVMKAEIDLSSHLRGGHESRVDNDSQTLYGKWEALQEIRFEKARGEERIRFESCSCDTILSNIETTTNAIVASGLQRPKPEKFACLPEEIASSIDHRSAHAVESSQTLSRVIRAREQEPALEVSSQLCSYDISKGSPYRPRPTTRKEGHGNKCVAIGKAAGNASPSGKSDCSSIPI